MLDDLKLQPIENWLKKNNWSFYDHQLETLKHSKNGFDILLVCLLYTSPSPRDATLSRMPSSA